MNTNTTGHYFTENRKREKRKKKTKKVPVTGGSIAIFFINFFVNSPKPVRDGPLEK